MLVTDGLLLTCDEPNAVLPRGALRIAGDRITDIASTDGLRRAFPDEEEIDADGMLVMPGLICAHTHFYGAFARGMPAHIPAPATLGQILSHLWWPLDRALRVEDVRSSAEVCLVDAIRHGTTALFDHHASPACVDGSLDVIADAVRAAGIRACLSYEVSDRNGAEDAMAGIRENLRFAGVCRRDPDSRLAAMMGLHASFTLSDETLERAAGEASSQGLGCHIHVAEGAEDVQQTLDRTGMRVVERLLHAGALGPRGIAAHCVHLDGYELALLRRAAARVAHNPRSNMHNGVGRARVARMVSDGTTVALGNDGFSNNMFIEMQAAYLVHQESHDDGRRLSPADVCYMSWSGGRKMADCFGAPVGVLRPGALADVILVDYRPTTPIEPDNAAAHILYGVDGTGVRTVICAGITLMRDGELLTLDEEAITARSQRLAAALWARMP
jgi:putative selenium metabolism protein SsnA